MYNFILRIKNLKFNIQNKLLRRTLMKLAYWMYAGPAHIGTLRVASSFKNVHAIMHAPLGDDYFV